VYKYWLLLPLGLLLLIELGLRLFWTNPYLLYAQPNPGFRLHEPGLLAYARVDGDLYPGEHRIRFRITPNRALAGTAQQAPSRGLALGGSTTECGLLPENRRWPDLLARPAHNFGVSGNFSLDSYHNLEFLLETGRPAFDTVLLMHGVNDLGRFLARGLDEFEHWSPRPITNVLVQADAVDQRVLPFLRVRDSALLSFIRYQSNNLKGRSFYRSLQLQRAAQEPLPALGSEAFEALRQRLRSELLPARRQVYRDLARLSKEANLRLLVLTQPHAYAADYRSPGPDDLRLFPVYRGNRLSAAQASTVMDRINGQTRTLAEELGLELVDVDRCFAEGKAGRWFYDSVHYTPAGAERFAACVDRYWN
jgi:lysophospholipase L1-like esterase